MNVPQRFILIDDDRASNMLARFILQRLFNTEVVDFLSPEMGIAYIEKEYASQPVPTVLLLDINMPNMTGWDVLDRLQAMPYEIRSCFKVFMLSSSVHSGDKEKARTYPLVSEYLEKPLQKDYMMEYFAEPVLS